MPRRAASKPQGMLAEDIAYVRSKIVQQRWPEKIIRSPPLAGCGHGPRGQRPQLAD